MDERFVDLCAHVPGLEREIRYATAHCLAGHPLAGYHIGRAVGTRELGDAMRLAFMEARRLGYGLLVYDAYRPQKAVDDLVAWCALPEDGRTKGEFYPALNKERLIPEGYIAARSGHSRGSTIDLTLTKNGMPADMGTPFDFMGEESHVVWDGIDPEHLNRRRMLAQIMDMAGFRPYCNEWWHFTLRNEPYPDMYFDFDID